MFNLNNSDRRDQLNSFIDKAGKATQEQEVITGRRSDDFKFDLLDLIEFGLRAVVAIGTIAIVIGFIYHVSARGVL